MLPLPTGRPPSSCSASEMLILKRPHGLKVENRSNPKQFVRQFIIIQLNVSNYHKFVPRITYIFILYVCRARQQINRWVSSSSILHNTAQRKQLSLIRPNHLCPNHLCYYLLYVVGLGNRSNSRSVGGIHRSG